jgi:hypothetical protein
MVLDADNEVEDTISAEMVAYIFFAFCFKCKNNNFICRCQEQ